VPHNGLRFSQASARGTQTLTLPNTFLRMRSIDTPHIISIIQPDNVASIGVA
jgi:hypothetical protein